MAAAVKDSFNAMLKKLNLSSNPSLDSVSEPDSNDVKQLLDKYEKANQAHVFHFYDELDPAEKASLFNQLKDIDPQHINEITKKALHPDASGEDNGSLDLEPLPQSASASVMDSNKDDLDAWYCAGLELIAQNSVGVVLMAGGQGTRLGSSAPKGCYNIGLPSKKSLFQLQAERILRVQELAALKHNKNEVVIPWYVMTSGPTREPTQKFFQQHQYFGLKQENVMIFEQGVLPCISNEGKILLESKSKVTTTTPSLWAYRTERY